MCLISVICSAQTTQRSDIIYEYEEITQKKGESLHQVLKNADLSDYQIRLVDAIPITKAAKSDRVFRLTYAVEKGRHLLRELRISRGQQVLNFVLTGTPSHHKFVQQASQISVSQMRKVAFWSAVTFEQQPEETLEEAWQVVRLTNLQKQIIQSGDFLKKARSTRNFILYFEGKGQYRLLQGLAIIRGNQQVEYFVENKNGQFVLNSLRNISGKRLRDMRRQFANARQAPARKIELEILTTLKPIAKARQTNNGPVVKSSVKPVEPVNKVVVAKSQGNYKLLSITQKKGQSISDACASSKLTRLQRELVTEIPVVKSAKSNRKFHLLFEHSGSRKYLKAVRVTRGGRKADFVLVKYKGKWTWANKKGEISTASDDSNGFLRYPLSFSRVSSHFNLKRRHPITRRIRPHKGTDFKAPHGAKIWAPASGVVVFAGRQRGYGITLEIDHQNGYRTKYAHLSRVVGGLRVGMRVKRRQVIAKVGNTGFSTGTHLHYEVIVNGMHRNPLTVKLPRSSNKSNSETKILAEAKKAVHQYLPKLKELLS